MSDRTDHMRGWRYCSRSGSVIKTDTDGDDLVIFKARSDHRSYQYSVLPAKEEAQAMRLAADAPKLLEALKVADQFITNGIELGYIRMPDTHSDRALKVPAMIRAALAGSAP